MALPFRRCALVARGAKQERYDRDGVQWWPEFRVCCLSRDEKDWLSARLDSFDQKKLWGLGPREAAVLLRTRVESGPGAEPESEPEWLDVGRADEVASRELAHSTLGHPYQRDYAAWQARIDTASKERVAAEERLRGKVVFGKHGQHRRYDLQSEYEQKYDQELRRAKLHSKAKMGTAPQAKLDAIRAKLRAEYEAEKADLEARILDAGGREQEPFRARRPACEHEDANLDGARRSSGLGDASGFDSVALSPHAKVALAVGGGVAAAGLLALAVHALRRGSGSGAASMPASWSRLYQYPDFIDGTLVTHSTRDADGWVLSKPSELAAQAGLDPEVYSLARIIGSETGDATAIEKAAVGWSVVNQTAKRGVSITALATTNRSHRPLYGTQEHGRFAASTRDPTDADVYVATMILAGEWPDPTGGATSFYGPAAQAALHAQCPADDDGHCLQPPSQCESPSGRVFQSCYRSVEAIIAKWTGEGKEVVVVPGVDPAQQLFFREAIG